MTRGNEQAFPLFTPEYEVDYGCHEPPHTEQGLTKRELFVALICAGDAANPQSTLTHEKRARWAVEQADALINALNGDVGPAVPPAMAINLRAILERARKTNTETIKSQYCTDVEELISYIGSLTKIESLEERS